MIEVQFDNEEKKRVRENKTIEEVENFCWHWWQKGLCERFTIYVNGEIYSEMEN